MNDVQEKTVPEELVDQTVTKIVEILDRIGLTVDIFYEGKFNEYHVEGAPVNFQIILEEDVPDSRVEEFIKCCSQEAYRVRYKNEGFLTKDDYYRVAHLEVLFYKRTTVVAANYKDHEVKLRFNWAIGSIPAFTEKQYTRIKNDTYEVFKNVEDNYGPIIKQWEDE